MLDIVIINWNSNVLLTKCVESILALMDVSLINKIFIIDNNSTDGSIPVMFQSDKIEVIRNQQNLGFAKACNQGFKLSSAPYLLLLNPDTQVFNDTIRACFSFMQKNNDIDILGCKLLNEKGEVTASCARFPTPLRMMYDAIGLSKIAPSVFTPATLMTDWDHGQSRYVDQVMGAFMFMRATVFDKIGFFDERFFVYYEELDFSYRLHKAGGKIYFNAEILAQHAGEGTTKAVKAFRLFLNLGSRLKYSKKHFSATGYMLVFFSTYIFEFISRFCFLILTGKFKEITDLAKAYRLLAKFRASVPVPG